MCTVVSWFLKKTECCSCWGLCTQLISYVIFCSHSLKRNVYCVCHCSRTNETNSVVIPPVAEEVIINGEQSDDEEEVPPSDDEEQEDSKDYCIGEY